MRMENDIRHPEVTDGKHPQSKLPARRRRAGVCLQVGVRRGINIMVGADVSVGKSAEVRMCYMWAGPNKYDHKCSMWVGSKHLRAEIIQRGPTKTAGRVEALGSRHGSPLLVPTDQGHALYDHVYIF